MCWSDKNPHEVKLKAIGPIHYEIQVKSRFNLAGAKFKTSFEWSLQSIFGQKHLLKLLKDCGEKGFELSSPIFLVWWNPRQSLSQIAATDKI